MRVPWTARRSKQSILKEINPEYSLQGLMLKLKLQYFGHLMRRTDSLEKTLMMGKIEGRRRRGRQRTRWLNDITDSMDMSLSRLEEIVGASLVAQMVKNLPAMQETHVLFLDGEDPLEKEWQPTPVFLPRKLHGQRSLMGYSPWGHKMSEMAE